MCWVTIITASGVKHRPRMAKVGCRPTTSPQSTAWRSTAGTMDPCHGTRQSTCSARASTGAFWSVKAKAAPVRGPFLCGMRGECTITGLTLRLMARWVSAVRKSHTIRKYLRFCLFLFFLNGFFTSTFPTYSTSLSGCFLTCFHNSWYLDGSSVSDWPARLGNQVVLTVCS